MGIHAFGNGFLIFHSAVSIHKEDSIGTLAAKILIIKDFILRLTVPLLNLPT
jgi:hypothetical protein